MTSEKVFLSANRLPKSLQPKKWIVMVELILTVLKVAIGLITFSYL